MKKFVLVLIAVLSMSGQAFAHGGRGYGGGHVGWVGPAIIGGIIGYELHRPQPYYYPPVVVQQPPVVVQQMPPQVIYQQPAMPYGYHYENILDANCNCYRQVLVPNQ
jgi:hypothetical protein